MLTLWHVKNNTNNYSRKPQRQTYQTMTKFFWFECVCFKMKFMQDFSWPLRGTCNWGGPVHSAHRTQPLVWGSTWVCECGIRPAPLGTSRGKLHLDSAARLGLSEWARDLTSYVRYWQEQGLCRPYCSAQVGVSVTCNNALLALLSMVSSVLSAQLALCLVTWGGCLCQLGQRASVTTSF